MKYYFIMFFSALILISSVNASESDYIGHKQFMDLSFTVTSNNATACNITSMETSSSVILLNLPMSKNANDFYITIQKNNFTELGDYCFNIQCTDGINIGTGSKCVVVSPNGNNSTANIVFYVFIILLVYGITFIGFFGKNIPVTILGGMAMIFLGVYTVNNGVIIFRDNLTLYFSYFTIAVGAIFALWAAIEWIQDNM